MSQTSSSPCAPGSADHCSERACSSPALLWPRKWAPLLLSLAIALAFRALATQAQCTAEFVTCLDDGTKAWPTTTQHADDSEQCAVNFSLPACAFFASLQSEVGGGQCGWTDVVAGKHGPAFLVLEGVRCLLPVVLPSFAEPLDLAKPHDDLCPVDAEAPPDDEASDVIALHEASFFSVVDGAAPAVAEPDFEPCVSSPLCSSFDGLRPDSTSACRLAGVAPPDSNDAGAQQVHTALLRLQGTIETTDGQKSTVVHNNTTTVVHGRGHLDTLAPAPPPVDSGLRHPNNVVLSIPLSIPVCPTTWGLPNDVAVKYADSYSDVCASAWASPARAPLGITPASQPPPPPPPPPSVVGEEDEASLSLSVPPSTLLVQVVLRFLLNDDSGGLVQAPFATNICHDVLTTLFTIFTGAVLVPIIVAPPRHSLGASSSSRGRTLRLTLPLVLVLCVATPAVASVYSSEGKGLQFSRPTSDGGALETAGTELQFDGDKELTTPLRATVTDLVSGACTETSRLLDDDERNGRLEAAAFDNDNYETNKMSLAAYAAATHNPAKKGEPEYAAGGANPWTTAFSDGEMKVQLVGTAADQSSSRSIGRMSPPDDDLTEWSLAAESADNPAKKAAPDEGGTVGGVDPGTPRPPDDDMNGNFLVAENSALRPPHDGGKAGSVSTGTTATTTLNDDVTNGSLKGDANAVSTKSSNAPPTESRNRGLASTTVLTQDFLAAYNSAAVGDTINLTPSATAYTGSSCTGSASSDPTSLCMTKAVTIACAVGTGSGSCTFNGLNTGTNGRRLVIVETGTTTTTTFQQLTFTKGYVGGMNLGSGMFISKSTTTILFCEFKSNTAGYGGGGLFISSSTVALTSCKFTSNSGVRSVVQLACLIPQILTSLFSSLLSSLGQFQPVRNKPSTFSACLPDTANTNL